MLKLNLITTLVTVGLAPVAAADLITWGPVQNAAAASDVRTTGVLVTAKNCWAQTFAAPVVNGVPFDAFAPAGWTNGGWLLNESSSTGDADYDALLDSARVTSGGSASNPTDWGAINLDTLGALVVGNTYEVQVWYNDQRPGTATNILFDRVMTLSSATGAATLTGGVVTNLPTLTQGPLSGGLDADPNNFTGTPDAAVGAYVVGTFTRTTNEPLWLLVRGSHPVATNVLRPHVNAFQVRDVTGASVGTNYCSANLNSTGASGVMSASGSATVASNDLVLNAGQLPLQAFGFFLTSATQGFVQNPGGSQGNLCLAGAIGRYVGPGQIKNSGATGAFSLAVNLNQHPSPGGFIAVQPGQSWNFTAWYRDVVGGSATSNFTDGLAVTFN